MEDKIEALRSTLEKAKEIIDEKIETSKESVQAAYDSHRSAASQKTLLDTCNDWVAIIKEDTFEKGRKTGYADACEHIKGILSQNKDLIDQYSVLANKSLSSVDNNLKDVIEKLKEANQILVNKEKEINQLKNQLADLARRNEDLRHQMDDLKKSLQESNNKEAKKTKKSRSTKKKKSDSLE